MASITAVLSNSGRWVTLLCIALVIAVGLLVLFDRPTRELFFDRPDRGEKGAQWYHADEPTWWEKW